MFAVGQRLVGALSVSGPRYRFEQADPRQMPAAQAGWALEGDAQQRARTVADFIAGMTDRYAAREHERLTGQRLLG